MLNKYLSRTKEAANGCLEWQGCLNSDGYPRTSKGSNSNLKVHREVFFIVNGYYPSVVRHTCDNIICVNPEHLISGDNIDNVNDRHERGRTYKQVSDVEIRIVKGCRELEFTYEEIAHIIGGTSKRVEYIMNKYVKEN